MYNGNVQQKPYPQHPVSLRPFLTVRIFEEIFGLGGRKYSWEKKKVPYEEYFPKISLVKISFRKKSSNTPSRGIFWLKILLDFRQIFWIAI